MNAHWSWLVGGILGIIGGILALLNPMAATFTVLQLTAIFFLVIGIFHIIGAIYAKGWGGRLAAIIVGLLCGLIGIFLLHNPLAGIVTLTLAVALMFLANGVFKLFLAWMVRGRQWFWLVLASGLLSLLLGIMILSGFPQSAATVLGLLLAVELISSGASLIGLWFARRAAIA